MTRQHILQGLCHLSYCLSLTLCRTSGLAPGEFRCAHGKKCIAGSRRCDGSPDCTDHSDEMGCQVPIKGCEHRCNDGFRCIPNSFVCDGETDCVDGSDERDCGERCLRPLVLRGEIEPFLGDGLMVLLCVTHVRLLVFLFLIHYYYYYWLPFSVFI